MKENHHLRTEPTLAVSELGESHITNAMLLDIIQDVIVQSVLSGDIEGPTGMYLLASVNMLGKLGWLEVRRGDEPPSSSKPEVDTSEAPRFSTEAFQIKKEKSDDASPEG